MTARPFQVLFSASARTGALDQVHHLAKSASRLDALAKMTSVVDEVAIELRKYPLAHPVAAAGAEFGITRYREITKSGYRAGYLVDEARREAVVLAIFRDGQDIRELLYRHLLTG
ncbi:hypothetical protein G7008_22865 [Pseudomonas psychrotolerans]|uniref:hypothetical protein n=1 Tax=Pseudomonas oryzihabitans TaxID=47885 RepID=UPI0015E387D5|nr:hypothetical protein [Pseudomonas psychrotolerans]MBA1183333.1 hypothetical protein [Pseudomonas psychrotolerans]